MDLVTKSGYLTKEECARIGDLSTEKSKERAEFLERNQENEPLSEDTVVYLGFPCRYTHCKYKGESEMTWGEIIKHDYEHFVQLMTFHVPVESRTFKALCSHLVGVDLDVAKVSERFQDSKQGTELELARFMKMTCGHKGKKNGLPWGEIREKDYNYFLFSVGNCMGRDSKTFRVMKGGLTDADQKMVMMTPKGEVRAPYKKNWKTPVPVKPVEVTFAPHRGTQQTRVVIDSVPPSRH
jgi:hypothetical protein